MCSSRVLTGCKQSFKALAQETGIAFCPKRNSACLAFGLEKAGARPHCEVCGSSQSRSSVNDPLVDQAMMGGSAEGRRMTDMIRDPAFEAAGGLVNLAAACPAAAQLDNDGVAIFWKSSKFVAHTIELHQTTTAVKVRLCQHTARLLRVTY